MDRPLPLNIDIFKREKKPTAQFLGDGQWSGMVTSIVLSANQNGKEDNYKQIQLSTMLFFQTASKQTHILHMREARTISFLSPKCSDACSLLFGINQSISQSEPSWIIREIAIPPFDGWLLRFCQKTGLVCSTLCGLRPGFALGIIILHYYHNF